MAPKSESASAKQAEQSKKDGNLYFNKKRYGAAIDAYTEAIALCPNVPVYLTNRALCHRMRSDWLRMEEDCRKAIQLNHSCVKAHYLLGFALLRKDKYGEGIRELEKALDLGRGENCMVEEIWTELAKAKYAEWDAEYARRSWEWQILREDCEAALKEKYILGTSQIEGFIDESYGYYMKNIKGLSEVFARAAEADRPTEVPDHLCCRITLDLLRDPVITPRGVTYERRAILEHLQKLGSFDPISREPLDEADLIPNLALKEAVQAFLDQHGWAYKRD